MTAASPQLRTGRPAPVLLAAQARGLLSQPWDLVSGGSAQDLVSQTLYGALVPVYAGDVISNVVFCVQRAGSGTTPTNVFVAVYDTSGVLLQGSADMKASSQLTATGLKQLALSATYTVTADGAVYVCFLENGAFGTNSLKLICANVDAAQGAALGSGVGAIVAQTGQTSMPATATFVAGALAPWLALS